MNGRVAKKLRKICLFRIPWDPLKLTRETSTREAAAQCFRRQGGTALTASQREDGRRRGTSSLDASMSLFEHEDTRFAQTTAAIYSFPRGLSMGTHVCV